MSSLVQLGYRILDTRRPADSATLWEPSTTARALVDAIERAQRGASDGGEAK